jgi:hypothetical protein
LVLSGEVSPRRVGIGGSGRFLVNAVRGRFLSDEPLTPWARVITARPSGVRLREAIPLCALAELF